MRRAARRMAVLPAHPPRRVDRRLAPDAAQRDRRRARSDGGPRSPDTQIRARPARSTAFGPSLTHAADIGVVEVTPNVSGRLPIETVDRLHAEVAGAEAVIPIVAALTPVDVAGGSHGFFLLGGSCQIELLVGSFNCEQRARDVKPADGPGVPLQMPTAIAERHGLQLGDELRIPGLPPGSAHLGWTFPEFDRVEGINDGYVLLAPSADIAASAALLARLRHGRVRPAETGR